MTTLYTIELEVIKKGTIPVLWRLLIDRLGLRIPVRIVQYQGTTDADSAVYVLQAAFKYYERKKYLIVKVSSVSKGGPVIS